MKIAAQVLFHARCTPERPAIVFNGAVVTYDMVGRGVTSACAALSRLGLPPGAVVGIEVQNPIQHVALILALELCGMTSCSVQTRYAIGKADLMVDALLIDRGGREDAGLRTVEIADDWFALDSPVDPALRDGVPDDRFYRIILSSGTTGRQKAIGYTPALTGRFLLRQAIMRGESPPRAISTLGFSTIGFLGPIFALLQGGTAFFCNASPETLRLIRTYEIARLGYIGVTHLEALVAAARVSGDAFPSLRVIHVTGSKLPPALAAEARARLCGNLIVSYASTEAGIVTYGRVGTPNMVDGAAGFVVPWVDIDTADAEGRPLRRGAEGLLRIRTPDLARYVLPAGHPGQIDPAAPFHPGDIGYVRDDGLLVITGRSGEVINRRGVIVAPDYIERVLEADPRVAGAAVFLRLDASGREEIWAAIVPTGTVDPAAVREASRSALGDKTPDHVELVDALPRTETGKLRRFVLKQRFSAPTA